MKKGLSMKTVLLLCAVFAAFVSVSVTTRAWSAVVFAATANPTLDSSGAGWNKYSYTITDVPSHTPVSLKIRSKSLLNTGSTIYSSYQTTTGFTNITSGLWAVSKKYKTSLVANVGTNTVTNTWEWEYKYLDAGVEYTDRGTHSAANINGQVPATMPTVPSLSSAWE